MVTVNLASPSSFPSKVPAKPELLELAPQAGQSWSGYWTSVTALALLLFVLFIAANGLLQKWLQLFIFTSPQPVTGPTGGADKGGTPAPASPAPSVQNLPGIGMLGLPGVIKGIGTLKGLFN